MSAATKAAAVTVEETEGLVRICELPGAALPIESCLWAEDQRHANLHLWSLLGELTGRLERSGLDGFTQRGAPGGWMALSDIDPQAIELVLRRITNRHPDWVYDAGSAPTTIDRVNTHFATAQLRRQRTA